MFQSIYDVVTDRYSVGKTEDDRNQWPKSDLRDRWKLTILKYRYIVVCLHGIWKLIYHDNVLKRQPNQQALFGKDLKF